MREGKKKKDTVDGSLEDRRTRVTVSTTLLIVFLLATAGLQCVYMKRKGSIQTHTEREQGSAVVVPTGCRMSTSS